MITQQSAMSSDKLTIRTMNFSDLELIINWEAVEGWNPGIHDAVPFYAADPGGFLIGEIDGEQVCCISAVRYGDSFGFIGLYIVQPAWRGKGLGLRTWNEGLKLLGDRPGALDAVLAQVDNYSKWGFKPAYRHIRYEYTGTIAFPAEKVVALTDIPFTDILNYDQKHFPASRPDFLKQWIKQPEGAAYGVIKNGNLCGYGVIRRSYKGFRIGPLFADDRNIAENLYQALANYAQGEPVYLDVTDANSQAIAFVESYGMNPVFECVRMYTHQPPDIDIAHIFGVTTLELG